MQDIQNIAQKVKSKDDFISFMAALIQDLETNPRGWENQNLESYLSAVQSWTQDMEGYYANNNLPIPENVSWKVFADILVAAKMYE